MTFPVSPSNGATYTTGGKTYVYNSTKGVWSVSNAGSSTVPTLINTGGGQTISGTLTTTGNINAPAIVNGNSNIAVDANSHVRISANGTANVVFVAANGNVGVGTATPSYKLDVVGGDSRIVSGSNFAYANTLRLRGSDTYQIYESAANTVLSVGTASGNIILSPSLSERVRVTTTGNVGIGNTAPTHRLSINGNLFTSSVSTNYQISSASATTVNTTTPTTIASVTITTVGKPVLLIASGDMNPQTGNDWNYIAFYRDSTQVGKLIIAQGGGASFNNPWAITHVDAPAAGTYTYTVKAYQGTGTTLYGETGAGQAPTLVAMELI